jgi:hypothetical protein
MLGPRPGLNWPTRSAVKLAQLVVVVVCPARGASPQSLEKAGKWKPQGERPRPEYRDPEKGDGGGTSSRRDGECQYGHGHGHGELDPLRKRDVQDFVRIGSRSRTLKRSCGRRSRRTFLINIFSQTRQYRRRTSSFLRAPRRRRRRRRIRVLGSDL